MLSSTAGWLLSPDEFVGGALEYPDTIVWYRYEQLTIILKNTAFSAQYTPKEAGWPTARARRAVLSLLCNVDQQRQMDERVAEAYLYGQIPTETNQAHLLDMVNGSPLKTKRRCLQGTEDNRRRAPESNKGDRNLIASTIVSVKGSQVVGWLADIRQLVCQARRQSHVLNRTKRPVVAHRGLVVISQKLGIEKKKPNMPNTQG